MHSTLHELRLTQRALRSSCRQCSARNQSPRRAFHRGPPLRNSQEPGNNGGSNSSSAPTDGKQDTEDKSPVAPDAAAAKAPFLPELPSSLRNENTTQPGTTSFYGSSWNRRQRVRAQQQPPEPPFVAPQWFYDNNAVIWGHPNGHPPTSTRRTDDLQADNDSHGSPAPDATPEEHPKDEGGRETKELAVSPTDLQEESSAKTESSQQTAQELPLGEGPYFVGDTQYNELLTTTRGLLRMSARQQPSGDPAAQANNLIIHYAAENGDYLLDRVVHRLAGELNSDVLTFDVQDIADLISHAGSGSKDPTTVEGRMLSYEVLVEVPKHQSDSSSASLEDDDAFEEPDSFDMSTFPGFPGLGGSSGRPMVFGKPFTVAIDLLRGAGDRKGGRESRPSMLDQLLSQSRPHSMNPRDLLDSAQVPLRSTLESLLSVVPSKRLSLNELPGRQQLADRNRMPAKSTIVHVKDIKAIQNVLVGSQFLSSLYSVVESKRNHGESIIIIGTECSKDGTKYSSSKIDSVQRTPEQGEISRTIVLSPFLPNQKARDQLEEDRQRRIATINLRHLWEMMRITSNDNFLGLEPGFWKYNIFDQLTSLDRNRLSKEVWSFQQVHRFTTYLGGMRVHDALIQEGEREEGKLPPVINSVGRELNTSDTAKVAGAEKTAAEADAIRMGKKASIEARLGNKGARERARVETKLRAKVTAKIEKIRATATKHEQRLMSGIIEPFKIRTTFKDVHAPAETIDSLQTLTTLSLIRPEAFSYGVLASDRIPGLLLYGPPGTGKTLLAKAVARESSATMLEVSAADLNDMFVGEGEKNVKALFSLARKLSPCIVFLDEADSMFSARGAAGRRASHRELLNQFLKEWDGMSNDSGSAFLMVATNRPMDFDDAVLRRLPRRLLVDLPTEKDREAILGIHLKSEVLGEGVDLGDLAKRTPFYSGSDLKNLCVAAALNAVREENAVAKREAEEGAATATTTGDDANGEGKEEEGEKQVEKKLNYPAVRTLREEHFRMALEEITSSVSEDMNSLKEIKKFDDVYGDKKGKKRKVKSWGFRRLGEGGEEIDGQGKDTVKVRE